MTHGEKVGTVDLGKAGAQERTAIALDPPVRGDGRSILVPCDVDHVFISDGESPSCTF